MFTVTVLTEVSSTGAAIERALGLISRGVRDRITVNGEIIRLETAMRTRWKNLEDAMADMEQDMNELGLNQTLRDSVSSVTSLDVRSYGGSGIITPGSSPASSVIMATSPGPIERRRSPAPTTRRPPSSAGTNRSGRSSSIPKKSPYNRLSTAGPISPVPRTNSLPTTSSMARTISSPGPYQLSKPLPSKPIDNRPRWNSSTNTSDSGFGHNFKPLSLTTPSPYRKVPPTQKPLSLSLPTSPATSRIPAPSPLSQAKTSNPNSPLLPGMRRSGGTFMKSPTPPVRAPPPSRPELRRQASMSRLRDQSRRQSQTSVMSSEYVQREPEEGKGSSKKRPASAMASARNRFSMLPRPTTPGSKRNSMPPGGGSDSGGGISGRPRWRH
jgi:Yeast cortical protein KAR9